MVSNQSKWYRIQQRWYRIQHRLSDAVDTSKDGAAPFDWWRRRGGSSSMGGAVGRLLDLRGLGNGPPGGVRRKKEGCCEEKNEHDQPIPWRQISL